jgi:transposase
MVTKDRLYRISRKLHELRSPLEKYLSSKTNELFDLEDKILLFDLTNTYFEGRMVKSSIAQFGRSKEKRSDAKLVVLAAVVNTEGFIKYSSILSGNMADCKTLAGMIETLRANTSSSAKKATVVIDAGIATDENLKMIQENGYDYICVSRAALTKYSVAADAQKITVRDNKNQTIELQRVEQKQNTDYYLKVDSHAKALKESSMENCFTERFEEELQKIAASLTKKGGVKQEDKVYLRLGRLQQKYPSAYRNYTFDIRVGEPAEDAKKDAPLPSKRIVVSMEWTKNEASAKAKAHGTYFIRTSLTGLTEELLWQFYNTIREIEATFRCLKTDLDLRPVYHKTDDNVMAHLHLGLLAYWIVNTVRFQLKKSGINSSWGEIVRIMNTQKAVTTTAQNIHEEVISIRKCSEPSEQVKNIYTALKYKHAPFARKKSVVHKSDVKKMHIADYMEVNSE